MNILELAKEAGIETDWSFDFKIRLERFVALVLKAEADETRARFAQPERPEREWIDLTDDELRNECKAFWSGNNSFEDFGRAVIAAFKEKNK